SSGWGAGAGVVRLGGVGGVGAGRGVSPPTPPSRTTPAPAPQPEEPKKPHDPNLCVPVIGLCVDAPVGPH
ncbi:class F sortase, partial [Streptomyces sp. WAC04114]|nr:class F sortase [Streptomyces sp. WAC04114]